MDPVLSLPYMIRTVAVVIIYFVVLFSFQNHHQQAHSLVANTHTKPHHTKPHIATASATHNGRNIPSTLYLNASAN